MEAGPRFALYYVPAAETPFHALGAGLLGLDTYTGAALPGPVALERAVPDWRELTQAPRVYGFHATLKAPFHLAPGRDEAQLRAACAAFAAAPRRVPVLRPVVDLVGGFAAIVPARASDAVTDLAAACVEVFEPFRAALTARDRERRNPAALTQRQLANLERWGYPFVMEEFRFHMTLTGRLPPERRAAILALLRDLFGETGARELSIDRLALLRQDATGAPFRVAAHWSLCPQASGSAR